MTEWISVEERLPDEFAYVVAAKHYNEFVAPDCYISVYINGRFTVCDDAIEASNYDGGASIVAKVAPTHWMPLPEPPTN